MILDSGTPRKLLRQTRTGEIESGIGDWGRPYRLFPTPPIRIVELLAKNHIHFILYYFVKSYHIAI
jgi:hypothetical protein